MKTIEDELYVVIKAYKFTVLRFQEIFVLSCIVCMRYPYILNLPTLRYIYYVCGNSWSHPGMHLLIKVKACVLYILVQVRRVSGASEHIQCDAVG